MSRSILQPGRNCWRLEQARRFYMVQDAADYFRIVRRALLSARHTVFVLGWDVTAGIDLDPGASPSEVPTRFDALLKYIVRRQRHLHCYILTWDYGLLFTLERDPFSRFRFGWATPKRVHFEFDDRHPLGASHHQKVVVIDDELAFCGGIDLTSHRWDTSAHRPDEPHRVTPIGTVYGPYHEIQAMVDGPVAASLGALARDRFPRERERKIPTVRPHRKMIETMAVPDVSRLSGRQDDARPVGIPEVDDHSRRRDVAHVHPVGIQVEARHARTVPVSRQFDRLRVDRDPDERHP